MKFNRIFSLILTVVLCLCVAAPVYVQAEGTESQLNGCVSLLAQKPVGGSDKLLDTSKAALLYELDSQTLVYAYQPDEQVDPSGMNKIMTALLAIEHGDLQAVVTLKKNPWDYAPAGSVSAELKKGEEIKMIDLLYCMMVGSANDASSVIAEHVGGNMETFVAMMNQRAVELGCKNTNFVNANGIKAEGQYSSARDLALITEAALRNNTFMELFCAESYEVPETNKSGAREMVTHNYMMSKLKDRNYFDERVIGGKTGALSTTDRSLICLAEHNGMRYLSVVMGAKGRVSEDGLVATAFGNFSETDALLDYGFEKFSTYNLIQQDHALEQFDVVNGENKLSVYTNQTVQVVLPKEVTKENISFRCVTDEALEAPIRKDQTVGKVTVWYNEICMAEYPLLSMHNVNAVGGNAQKLPLTYVPEPQGETVKQVSLWGTIVILYALAVGGVILLFMRLVNGIKQKRMRNAMNVPRRR